MLRELKTSILAVVVLTLLLGVGYPLVVTGIARIAFADKAGGSLIDVDGTTVGSRQVAQAFDRPVLDDQGEPALGEDGSELREPDPAWFQPRPSQTGYAANATGFLNLGPNTQDLADLYDERVQAYLDLESPHHDDLDAADIPVDAVTNSGSGIDPHVSIANARIQAARVADERGVREAQVRDLIDEHVAGRFLGVFGEPGVNVLELNLALDKEYPQR